MSRSLAFARCVLTRQAKQTALAVAIVATGWLAFVPLVVLTRVMVASPLVPLGLVPLVLMLGTGLVTLQEELVVQMLARNYRRMRQCAATLAGQGAVWAAVCVAAHRRGEQVSITTALALHVLVHILGRPVVFLLWPGQRCGMRLRRMGRDLAFGPVRTIGMCTGMLVVLYIHLTVFTQLEPLAEVMVMGFAVPLLQAACKGILGHLVRRMERQVALRANLRASMTHSADSAPRKRSHLPASLLTVVIAEIGFAASATATLMLAETDRTFLLALVSMLCIEIVQVALHVKTWRVISRVAPRSTTVTDDATLASARSDDSRLCEWLLHQELGEKMGSLMAVSSLGVDQVLWHSGQPVQETGDRQLAKRGLALVLLGLLAHIAKDMVSRALGVAASSNRASLPMLGVFVVVVQTISVGFLIECGLVLYQ